MIQTFWFDQNNQPQRSNQKSGKRPTTNQILPKSVPRGDDYGSRGSDREEEWLLVAEEEADLVCEMLWPTLRLTGWVKRCEVDIYSKSTHRWTFSIFIMSTPFAKRILYTLFVAFCVAFSHSTYTCALGMLDWESAQMLWRALDTHTLSTHSWISSIFIMSTPFAKRKLYTLFVAFFVAFSHSTYTCALGMLDWESAQMLWHALDTHTLSTHSWISSIFIMSTPFAKRKLYTLFLAF